MNLGTKSKFGMIVASWLLAAITIAFASRAIHQSQLDENRVVALAAKADSHAGFLSSELRGALAQIHQLSRAPYFSVKGKRESGASYPKGLVDSMRDFSSLGWYSVEGRLLEGLVGEEPEIIDLALFRTDVANFCPDGGGYQMWAPVTYHGEPAMIWGWRKTPLLSSDSGNQIIIGAEATPLNKREHTEALIVFPENETLVAKLRVSNQVPARESWVPYLLLPLCLLFPLAAMLWMGRSRADAQSPDLVPAVKGDALEPERFDVVRKMAGGVAHDFRNFLTVILGNLSLLDRASENERAELVNDATHAAMMASDLAEELMSLSDKRPAKLRSLASANVMHDAQRLVSKTLPFNVDVRVEAVDDLWPVSIDATQLGRVFNNLITNATHAMPKGGVITLSARNLPGSPDMVEYRVVDEGVGMAPETMEHIFEPFYSTKGKKLGSVNGLGLYNALTILQGHGGSIQCDSVQGEGTTFFLRVLRATDPVEPEDAVVDSPVRLLVVDDEEAFRVLTTELLTRSGYQVVTAANGKEAVDVCSRSAEDFDLILLDLKMPVLSGSKVFRLLRERGVQTPIVICTGFKDQMETFKVEAGDLPDGVVTKPFDFEVLVETVERVMNNDPRIRN